MLRTSGKRYRRAQHSKDHDSSLNHIRRHGLYPLFHLTVSHKQLRDMDWSISTRRIGWCDWTGFPLVMFRFEFPPTRLVPLPCQVERYVNDTRRTSGLGLQPAPPDDRQHRGIRRQYLGGQLGQLVLPGYADDMTQKNTGYS